MLAAINTTSHSFASILNLTGGVKALLTDRNKLIMTVGGATALAAGVYTTRYAPPNYISYFSIFRNLYSCGLRSLL